MEIRKSFYDLCVPYTGNNKELSQILEELYEYGYRTVAIEQTFDHPKESKKSNDIFPTPVLLDAFHEEFKNKLRILSRLTIIYADPIISHAMTNSLNLKKYNLIAGKPKTDQAMQHCCSAFSGDIIAANLDDSTRAVVVNHKYYQIAVRRGMCFEIQYSPMIIDSNKRREIISLSHMYASQRQSKNIIICSGALNKFQIRGPYDVSNLGLVFGLSEEQSKGAISHVCRSLLLKAEARNYGKTVMTVKSINSVTTDSDNTDDDSDESIKMDVTQERDVDQSDTDSSIDLIMQPSKKKKVN